MRATETREAEGVTPYAAPLTDDGLVWTAASSVGSVASGRTCDSGAARGHRPVARFICGESMA
jgi:hypothetical protein